MTCAKIKYFIKYFPGPAGAHQQLRRVVFYTVTCEGARRERPC